MIALHFSQEWFQIITLMPIIFPQYSFIRFCSIYHLTIMLRILPRVSRGIRPFWRKSYWLSKRKIDFKVADCILWPFLLFLTDTSELTTVIRELNYRICVQSAKLLRLLKQKDRLLHKVQRNCDIVTACLQAVSPKRRKYYLC